MGGGMLVPLECGHPCNYSPPTEFCISLVYVVHAVFQALF